MQLQEYVGMDVCSGVGVTGKGDTLQCDVRLSVVFSIIWGDEC